jgi:diguanylate cyclase (GGDEF)-like protein/PAS domain S-box-containing protein
MTAPIPIPSGRDPHSQLLWDMLEQSPDIIVCYDLHLRRTYGNAMYERHTGQVAEQYLGRSILEYSIVGSATGDLVACLQRAVKTGQEQTLDFEWRSADGRLVCHSLRAAPVYDAAGHMVGLVTVSRDITERTRVERALRESEARIRTVADALPLRVAYIDIDERYRFNNLAYERGFGLTRQQILGRTVRELLGDAAYRTVEPYIRAVLRGESVTFQSEMTTGDTYVCYEAHYIPQFAENGDTVGFHAVVADITRQKLEERRLVHLTRIDALTGVANRAGFELRLDEAITRSRATGALVALMYLDIDNFKQINDQHGHQAGDALLRAFAGRLSQTLRSSDTVTRLGGDEFTVIMDGLSKPDVAATVATKIIRAMEAPFVVEQQSIKVTTSIGLAFCQGGAMTAETLVRQADEMLYQAKRAGRNTYQMASV